MRVTKLIAVLFLASAPLTLAACGASNDGGITGSAVEDPSKPVEPVDPNKPAEPSVPGQPGAPSVPGGDKGAPAPSVSGGVTLESFISGLPPTKRVDIHD